MATFLRTVQRLATPRTITPFSRVGYTTSTLNSKVVKSAYISNNISTRYYSSDTGAAWAELPDAERENVLLQKLQQELDAKDVNIIDLSGGCGTMYRIELSSSKFKGKSMLEQHRMVNSVLASEIKNMHGLTLKTVAE